jgi:hypothetical protein
MATKLILDAAMDALLDYLGAVDLIELCEAMPADYTDAITAKGSGGHKLGSASPGSFTKADGDTSGRKTTMAQVSGISITVTGTWDYVAGTLAAGTTLRFALPLSNAPITGGSQGSKQFIVTGDVTSYCTAGKIITVRGSTGNDGVYTVVSSSYGAPSTTVTVSEAIPSATFDGILIYGAQSVTNGNSATLNALKVDEVRDPS